MTAKEFVVENLVHSGSDEDDILLALNAWKALELQDQESRRDEREKIIEILRQLESHCQLVDREMLLGVRVCLDRLKKFENK